VRAEGEGRLSREELIANLILLFGAGQDTTSHFIGNAFVALQRQPEELRRLRADLSLLPNAVEELLRYDPSVQVALRHVLEDAEVGGVPMRRGEGVLAFLAAANRDPLVHPDPDRLDITRRGVRVLSFGGGLHHCLGAHLARLEALAALRALLTRLPGLRLDESQPLAWRRTFTVRGPERLPVLWDA
jgi:hypothetical protein